MDGLYVYGGSEGEGGGGMRRVRGEREEGGLRRRVERYSSYV